MLGFQKYLYSKIKGAHSKYVNLILTNDELSYLNKFKVEYKSKTFLEEEELFRVTINKHEIEQKMAA